MIEGLTGGLASSIARVTELGTKKFLSNGSRRGASGEVVCVLESDSTEVRVGLKKQCTVSTLRHKLIGILPPNEQAEVTQRVSSEVLVLVFRGRALRDSDTVPDACFKETDRDDPDWEPYEIWISRYSKTLDTKDDAMEVRRSSHKGDDGVEESDLSNGTETGLQSKETVSTSRRLKHRLYKSVTPDFDLQAELDRIDCGDAGEQLIAEGYGDRGAFSHVNDDVLSSYPFYIAKCKRRRIIGLAEHYREIEGTRHAEPSSVLEEMASPVKNVVSTMQQDFDNTIRLLQKLEETDEEAASLQGRVLLATSSNGENELSQHVSSAQRKASPNSRTLSDRPGSCHNGQEPSPWLGAAMNVGKAVPSDVSVYGVSLQAHLNALLKPVVWQSLMRDVAVDEATIVKYLERLLREAFNGNDDERNSQLLAMFRANDAARATRAEQLHKCDSAGTWIEPRQKLPLPGAQPRILKNTLIQCLSQQLYSNAAAQKPPACCRIGLVDARQRLANEHGAKNPSCIFSRGMISHYAQQLVEKIAARPDCNLDDFDLPIEDKRVLTKTASHCCNSHAWSIRTRLSNFAQLHRATARRAMWTFLAGADASEPTRADLYMFIRSLLSTLGLAERPYSPCPCDRVEVNSAFDSNSIGRSLTVTQFDIVQCIGAALHNKAAFVEAVATAAAETALCHIDLRKRADVLALIRAQDSVHPQGVPCVIHAPGSQNDWQVQQLVQDHMRTLELYVGFRNAGYLNY